MSEVAIYKHRLILFVLGRDHRNASLVHVYLWFCGFTIQCWQQQGLYQLNASMKRNHWRNQQRTFTGSNMRFMFGSKVEAEIVRT
uniref:Uncharacterized protein n=1 Tax=Octopus bimaculoides TaxID=37653 RepID=A0A0L8GZY3_OCTBM